MNYYSTLTEFGKSSYINNYVLEYFSNKYLINILILYALYTNWQTTIYIAGLQCLKMFSSNIYYSNFIDLLSSLVIYFLNAGWFFTSIIFLKTIWMYLLFYMTNTPKFSILLFFPNLVTFMHDNMINGRVHNYINLITTVLDDLFNPIQVYTYENHHAFLTDNFIIMGKYIRPLNAITPAILDVENKCDICYEQNKEVFVLLCGHMICSKCGIKWYSTNNKCLRCFLEI